MAIFRSRVSVEGLHDQNQIGIAGNFFTIDWDTEAEHKQALLDAIDAAVQPSQDKVDAGNAAKVALGVTP